MLMSPKGRKRLLLILINSFSGGCINLTDYFMLMVIEYMKINMSIAHKKINQVGNAAVHILIGIVMVAAIAGVAWRVADAHHKKNVAVLNTNLASTETATSTPSSPTPPSTTLPAGTDNTTLNSDLNSINTSLNQESRDQSSSNTSLNDAQYEIQVPTN